MGYLGRKADTTKTLAADSDHMTVLHMAITRQIEDVAQALQLILAPFTACKLPSRWSMPTESIKRFDTNRIRGIAAGKDTTMPKTPYSKALAVILVLVTGLLLAMPVTAFASGRPSEGASNGAIYDPELNQLIGEDRYETAAKIALEAYPTGSAGAIIASGANFPDALSASTLAGHKDYPIILVEPGRLTDVSASALQTLKGSAPSFEIIIVGGESAVSPSVATTLGGYGSVSRLSGDDRYLTNLAIYESIPTSETNVTTAILATGKNFPDALSISPLAAAEKMSIVLCNGKSLEVEQAVQLSNVSHVIIVGGADVVSQAIANQLADQGKTVERWEGDDRYKTSLDIARHLTSDYAFNLDDFTFATGAKFPDALASGPYAAGLMAPVLLIEDNAQSQPTIDWLTANRLSVANGYSQAGGYNALDPVGNLKAALRATWVAGTQTEQWHLGTYSNYVGVKILYAYLVAHPEDEWKLHDSNAFRDLQRSGAIDLTPADITGDYSTVVLPHLSALGHNSDLHSYHCQYEQDGDPNTSCPGWSCESYDPVIDGPWDGGWDYMMPCPLLPGYSTVGYANGVQFFDGYVNGGYWE